MNETGDEIQAGSTEEEANKSLTGMDFTEALKDEKFEAKQRSIVLVLKDGLAPEVSMVGFWDGNLLRAAMRAIEKQYDEIRRHATVWAMKKSQANAE